MDKDGLRVAQTWGSIIALSRFARRANLLAGAVLLAVDAVEDLILGVVKAIVVERPMEQRDVGPVHLYRFDLVGAVIIDAAVAATAHTELVAAHLCLS